MMNATTNNLEEMKLVLLFKQEKVFSGYFKDLPDFSAAGQPVDRVEFYEADGAQLVSMAYHDFEIIVGNQFN